jgi:hypothetical protein
VTLDLLTAFWLCKSKALEIGVDFVSVSVGFKADGVTASGNYKK